MFVSRRTLASDGRALSVLVDLLLLLWRDGSMSGVSYACGEERTHPPREQIAAAICDHRPGFG
jgi:hypothetical protein